MPEIFFEIRMPAEWEPQSAVQLTLPHAGTDWSDMLPQVMPVFLDIVKNICPYEKVILVCSDQKSTRAWLSGVPAENLILVEAPSNDTWARDHGAITVESKGQLLLLDFVFNGWGLKFPAYLDNGLNAVLKQQAVFRVPMHFGGLVLEGGGIETDGMGTLLSTIECMLSPNRNPHLNLQELEAALSQKMGFKHFLWLHHGYLAGDDTDSHIDTLARFCDPETIAYVRCDNPDDEHYTALQLMEQELKAFRTTEGKPYQLVPLPWPDACFAADGHRLPATYANFLIINKAVLVPTYQVPQDELAISVLQSVFPDRSVVGINCRPLIEQHGSLHCVTMQYPEGVI